MAKQSKYYVVWRGINPGIYTSWSLCERNVKGFKDARFKSFPTKSEAEAAFAAGAPQKTTKSNKPKPVTAKKTRPIAVATDVTIYSDGACEGNPGDTGSGMAVYHNGELIELWYGLHEHGTNNTAELKALHQALIRAKECIKRGQTVKVYSDSMYSINAVTNWAFAWKQNNWMRGNKPVKNQALVMEIHELYVSIEKDVLVYHVKGHAGIEGNELADRMAVLAVAEEESDFTMLTTPYDVEEILTWSSDSLESMVH